MKPLIFLDMDDSLTGCRIEDSSETVLMHKAYDRLINRLCEEIASEGFTESALEVRSIQQKIDGAMLEKYGFGDLSRFASSFVSTYQNLCLANYRVADTEVEHRLFHLGMEVFERVEYVALPGAVNVLDALSRFYRIVVVTRGHQEEQHKKAVDSGILPYVDHFFAVDFKDARDWRNVFDKVGLGNWLLCPHWAVGDGIRTDVNLPLSFGLNAVHISLPNAWERDIQEYKAPFEGSELHVVPSIGDVLKVIPMPRGR